MNAWKKAVRGMALASTMVVATGAGTAAASPATGNAERAKRPSAIYHLSQINGYGARGWVKDNANDGWCVQIMIRWYKNGQLRDTDLSARVCGQGRWTSFSLTPGDRHHFKASAWKTYLRYTR
ncbi:hypothetical protein A6A06_01340 [Streptomyces sp. CB02923]|uniref:hypothetical protein n=1 Tax=Streptomyces sp. CB02923 TaxID=1718985 RepID=UPI00093B8333|nr:hypothetical protein [Streptomyces sp. CB02923]OKI09384.1 hypothetical protein A6A06_01340 [Streptomyces sp. CB02923]